MISTTHATPPPVTAGGESAAALALRLAHAENALLALSSGQIDAIIDPQGRASLLRPAQEDLRKNERRLQAIIDSVPDAIMVVNRGGEILSLSHAARKVLGCEPETLTGRSIFENIHPDDFPAVYAAFFNVAEGIRKNAGLQFRHGVGDGSYRVLQATVAQLRGDSSSSVIFSLRPGLHRIFQSVEPVRPGPAKDGFLAMQARLVAELFEFNSAGERKIRLQSQRLDAHEAIRLALENTRHEITEAQIQVLLDLRATEPLVLADAGKLQQVLWNLLKNAISSSPRQSTISVSTLNVSSDQLAIDFADPGIRIEPDQLPLVFDCFWQGDPTNHQVRAGRGPGLFVAKVLAEAQGGTLTARSEGRGPGATFCLTLIKAPPDGIAPTEVDQSTETDSAQ